MLRGVGQERLDDRGQPGEALQAPAPAPRIDSPDDAHFQTKIAQRAAQIGFRVQQPALKQLAAGQQYPLFLATSVFTCTGLIVRSSRKHCAVVMPRNFAILSPQLAAGHKMIPAGAEHVRGLKVDQISAATPMGNFSPSGQMSKN